MTGDETAQIILSIGTLVASIGGVIVSIMNSRGIDHVKRATNGMVTALVTATELGARAQGKAEGKAEERQQLSVPGNAATTPTEK